MARDMAPQNVTLKRQEERAQAYKFRNQDVNNTMVCEINHTIRELMMYKTYFGIFQTNFNSDFFTG